MPCRSSPAWWARCWSRRALAGAAGLLPTYLVADGTALAQATGFGGFLAGILVPIAHVAVGVVLLRGAVPKFGLAYAGVAAALSLGQLLIEIYRGSSSTSRPGVEVLAGARVLTSGIEIGPGWVLGVVALGLTVLAGILAAIAWGRTVMDDGGAIDPARAGLAGAAVLLGVLSVLSLTLPPADVPDRIVTDPATGLQTVVTQEGPQALFERPGLALLGGLLLAGALVLCSVIAPSLRPRLAAVGGLLAIAVDGPGGRAVRPPGRRVARPGVDAAGRRPRAGRARLRRPHGARLAPPPHLSPRLTAMADERIRVVIAKPGLDGHDRGAKVVARALRDAGMEVVYTGLHQTPEQIVETVVQEDADAVGLSVLSGAHMTLFARLSELMREREVDDVVVFGGGIIPDEDIPELERLGVTKVFTPGATTTDIVDWVRPAHSVGATASDASAGDRERQLLDVRAAGGQRDRAAARSSRGRPCRHRPGPRPAGARARSGARSPGSSIVNGWLGLATRAGEISR